VNVEPLNLFNVFLIGYRCTGKTSVGKLLSAKLGWPFIDTDSLLVSDSGRSIKEIVATDGWEAFRKMEHAIIKEICALDRRIVATGGGIVLNADNVKLMKKRGKLVWLRATPETIKKRMMQDTDTEAFRPALTTKNSMAEVGTTLVEREPLYEKAMDFFVDTDNQQVDEVCDAIIYILSVCSNMTCRGLIEHEIKT
jgi:shikimate kinase